MIDIDQIETWAPDLRTLLMDELPVDIERILINARRKYVEDARDIVLGFGTQDNIISKVSTWLQAQPIVGYHGSRLTFEEIRAIRLQGLRPLVAEERQERLARILSRHPSWPNVEAQLPDALRKHGVGNFEGRREGQVHLTLSRSALTRSFNHYLVEGSEFDGHVAQCLLGSEGRQILRTHGEPVMFAVHVPAGLAFAACNPHGRFGTQPPNPVRNLLTVWSRHMVAPNYDAYDIDAGMTFKETVPAAWIKSAIPLNDADLIPYYHP